MRLFLVALLALMIGIPSAAIAQSSSSSGSTSPNAVMKKKKKKQQQQKQTKSKAKKKVGTKKAAKAAPTNAKPQSTSNELEVKGTISALSATSITVGTSTCAISSAASVAGFAVGDFVELECRLVGGVWTLAKLKREDADEGEIEVKGTISALSSTSITVGATTCAIRPGTTLVGFSIGDLVEMECDLVGGVPTLVELELEDDDSDSSGSGSGSDDDDDDDDEDDEDDEDDNDD